MSDFQREALTNPHLHAAVTAGTEALLRNLPDTGVVGHELAERLSATVVEAVRAGVFREAAGYAYDHVATCDHCGGAADEVLKRRADELDEERRQRHQTDADRRLEALRVYHNIDPHELDRS